MRDSTRRIRAVLLCSVVLLVLVVFGIRLAKMQIADRDYYQNLADKSSVRIQTVQAARGEILDRNGRPLAVNRTVFNIVFDRAYLRRGQENETILKLMGLLEQTGEEWIDNLPITATPPFAFTEDSEADVSRLKKTLGINEYATVDDVVYQLRDQYGLEEYDDLTMRRLAGVRYEMTFRAFSYETQYTFAEDISTSTAAKVKEWSFDLPGVDVVESTVREYPAGEVAAHLIGRTGLMDAEEYAAYKELGYKMNDTVGKEGIELAYESELRGQSGKRQIVLTGSGEVVEVTETEAPRSGNNVILTIDYDLQKVALESLGARIEYLRENAKEYVGREAEGGAAVAIHVPTGELLACASYPSFNLENYLRDYKVNSQDPLRPLWNRALFGQYAPGSTFKPATATAGLASGTITPTSIVNCGGIYRYFTDYQPGCEGVHGNIDVRNALRVSCNIFFYDTGRRMGIETLNQYAYNLGLAQPTGIELPEAAGQMDSRELAEKINGVWNPGDVLQASIGQGRSLFTPIQMANYAATMARGGTRLETHLVKSITTYNMDETLQETIPVTVVEMDLSDETVQAVREGMVMSSSAPGGSSVSTFGNYPIKVASKTGTPQSGSTKDGKDLFNAAYICYAPADDPQIAVAIIAEKAGAGYLFAPVARDILNEYFFGAQQALAPQTPETLLP